MPLGRHDEPKARFSVVLCGFFGGESVLGMIFCPDGGQQFFDPLLRNRPTRHVWSQASFQRMING
jgi:hypothetical protein